MRLRDYLPRGLYWRTALIIIVPAALLQLIITLVFLDDHWRFQSKRMSQAVASDVTLLLQRHPRPRARAGVRLGRVTASGVLEEKNPRRVKAATAPLHRRARAKVLGAPSSM